MQSAAKIRKRGRPRSFDSKEALAAAQAAFARKGYSATTLDDLSAAMGINRPSLYAAFSDKETLYQKALALYSEKMGASFRDALNSEATFAKALRKLYGVALDAYVSEDGEIVGCMVACTAVTEAIDHDRIRRQSKSIFDTVDALAQSGSNGEARWRSSEHTDARAFLASRRDAAQSGDPFALGDQPQGPGSVADDAAALIVASRFAPPAYARASVSIGPQIARQTSCCRRHAAPPSYAPHRHNHIHPLPDVRR